MTHNPNKDACEESGVCSFVGKLGREISEKYEMYQQLALRALLDHVRTYVRTVENLSEIKVRERYQ